MIRTHVAYSPQPRRSLERVKMPFEIRHFVETNFYWEKITGIYISSMNIESMILYLLLQAFPSSRGKTSTAWERDWLILGLWAHSNS